MSRLIHRRHVLHTGLAMAALLVPPLARACEFWTTGLRVLQPWTRATEEGDEFAVVCMKFDLVSAPDRLIGVETPVASGADLGGIGARPTVDFAIAAGMDSALDEGGTFIRLLGLSHPLELARTYPLKLRFEKGGIVNADLDVDYERRTTAARTP
jgi:copper(I)-binding protein